MAFLSGNGILLKSGTTILLGITNVTLKIDDEVIDVSNKGDANWEDLLEGKGDVQIGVEGFIDWQAPANAGVVLLDACDAATSITAVFERSETASASEFQKITCTMLVSEWTMTANDGEGKTFSATLELSGGTPTIAEGT